MKKCPFCAEDIQDAAIVCKHCGRDLATGTAPQQTVIVQAPRRTWSPGVAAVLSLVIPGAGQMYKGKVGAGLAFLFCTVIGYMLYIVPGLILHIICIVNAASGAPNANAPTGAGAARTSWDLTPEEREKSRRQGRLILTVVGVTALLAICGWLVMFFTTDAYKSRTTTSGNARYGTSTADSDPAPRTALKVNVVRGETGIYIGNLGSTVWTACEVELPGPYTYTLPDGGRLGAGANVQYSVFRHSTTHAAPPAYDARVRATIPVVVRCSDDDGRRDIATDTPTISR